nr:MAG TPA: hypothetical protein [Caudoviricetes sp.]
MLCVCSLWFWVRIHANVFVFIVFEVFFVNLCAYTSFYLFS